MDYDYEKNHRAIASKILKDKSNPILRDNHLIMCMVNKKILVLLCLLVPISGCIGYPISEQSHKFEISGDANGKKSNPDEKIIEVGTDYGTQWVLSPEGPRRRMDSGPSSFSYYLDKNGRRSSLPFLHAIGEKERWNFFINIDSQWFAFNVDAKTNYFVVAQFSSYGNSKAHEIDVFHTGAITEMYIDQNAKYLVWKESNNGYHQYMLSSETKTRRSNAPLPTEIDKLIKIPGIAAKYDDIAFEDAAVADYYRYSRYSPLTVARTQSLELLHNASNARHYLNRWAVAINPNTPRDLLEDLKNDESYYVANQARKRLASTPEESENSDNESW